MQASRKVSKCGYLFVAPDWDFTIPLYRTKVSSSQWATVLHKNFLSRGITKIITEALSSSHWAKGIFYSSSNKDNTHCMINKLCMVVINFGDNFYYMNLLVYCCKFVHCYHGIPFAGHAFPVHFLVVFNHTKYDREKCVPSATRSTRLGFWSWMQAVCWAQWLAVLHGLFYIKQASKA